MHTQLRFPARLIDTVLDKETEFDGNLPEYCPDVIRLIRVDCTPYVDGCECTADKIHMHGRIVYDVLYETDRKNKLRYCSFTQEFRHSADLPMHELENMQAVCRAACSKITCKMLSPRRLVLRARLELHTSVCGETVVSMLSAQPIDGMFFRTKHVRLDTVPETVGSETHFDETLPLLQGEKRQCNRKNQRSRQGVVRTRRRYRVLHVCQNGSLIGFVGARCNQRKQALYRLP